MKSFTTGEVWKNVVSQPLKTVSHDDAFKVNASISGIQMYCTENKESIVYNELNRKYLLEQGPQYFENALRTKSHTFRFKTINAVREWQKSKQPNSQTAEEWYQLLVVPLAYPTFEIRQHDTLPPQAFYWRARLEPHWKTIDTSQKAVGRLQFTDNNNRLQTCSGFLCQNDIFVCAIEKDQHLVNPLKVDFSCEQGTNPTESFQVKKIISRWPDKKPNVYFIQLESYNSTGSRLPSAIRLSASLAPSNYLLTIGYPKILPGQLNTLAGRAIFGPSSPMNNKQASPGHFINYRKHNESYFTHDCSTAWGSAGSPIFDLKSGQVVGMHISTIPTSPYQGKAIASTILTDLLQKLKKKTVSEMVYHAW